MPSIKDLLDTLAAERSCLDGIKTQIDSLAGDLAIKRDAQAKCCADLEAMIKGKAKFVPESQAHTLVGKLLQLVWTPAKQQLDQDRTLALLQQLGASQEQIAALYEQRDGYWAIRKTKAK